MQGHVGITTNNYVVNYIFVFVQYEQTKMFITFDLDPTAENTHGTKKANRSILKKIQLLLMISFDDVSILF